MLINELSDNINAFIRHFQEKIKVFHPKAQVWKAKLQTFTDLSIVGFIMYIAHMLQVHHLIENVVTAIERENWDTKKKTAIHSEVAFHNEEDRRAFYNIYNRNDEYQRIAHNHRKLTTICCAPKYRNLLVINLLSAFSSDPDQKYVTAGTQQRFIQAPGVCLAYQPHRNFS